MIFFCFVGFTSSVVKAAAEQVSCEAYANSQIDSYKNRGKIIDKTLCEDTIPKCAQTAGENEYETNLEDTECLVCCVILKNPESASPATSEEAGVAAGAGIAGPLVSFDPHGYTPPLGNADVPTIVGNVVKTVLPLVGSLFLIMFVYGGFLYMTASGDEKKVSSARKTLFNAVIGMAIVMGAYTIVAYVLKILTP